MLKVMSEHILWERSKRLDANAKKVLERSIYRIGNAKTYDDVFTAISAYLWINASKMLCDMKKINGMVSLTDNIILEICYGVKWIENLRKNIDIAKYDLKCMEEAENLSFGERIALGMVENPDVFWYANKDNISYFDRKQRLGDCRNYIKEHEIIFFASLVTVTYLEKMRRRYR